MRADIAENWKSLAERWLGRRLVIVIVGATIIVPAVLDFFGTTITGWGLLKSLVQEKTTTLSSSEHEIKDEWVILIDTAEDFGQAESYRENLSRWMVDPGFGTKDTEKEAADHFQRNLRVVRHPENLGEWLLIADVNGGRSSEETVNNTVNCIKKRIKGWEGNDVISPWFKYASAFDYDLKKFQYTYGRIENIDKGYTKPADSPESGCPGKYNY